LITPTEYMFSHHIGNYKKLVVWIKAKELVVQLYRILKKFPKDEIYGLTAQMKRASVSVASNIAEGNQRRSTKEKLRFFNISQGSLVELDCQMNIAFDLEFIGQDDYNAMDELINKSGYLRTRLIQSEMDKLK
jgi:four helix bundle protein